MGFLPKKGQLKAIGDKTRGQLRTKKAIALPAPPFMPPPLLPSIAFAFYKRKGGS